MIYSTQLPNGYYLDMDESDLRILNGFQKMANGIEDSDYFFSKDLKALINNKLVPKSQRVALFIFCMYFAQQQLRAAAFEGAIDEFMSCETHEDMLSLRDRLWDIIEAQNVLMEERDEKIVSTFVVA